MIAGSYVVDANSAEILWKPGQPSQWSKALSGLYTNVYRVLVDVRRVCIYDISMYYIQIVRSYKYMVRLSVIKYQLVIHLYVYIIDNNL